MPADFGRISAIRYLIVHKLLREPGRSRWAAAPVYFKALGELRAEARQAHAQAIAGQADFAQVIRIWLSVQWAFAELYVAWFLPRRSGWGLLLGQHAAGTLNERVWKVVPIRSGG